MNNASSKMGLVSSSSCSLSLIIPALFTSLKKKPSSVLVTSFWVTAVDLPWRVQHMEGRCALGRVLRTLIISFKPKI